MPSDKCRKTLKTKPDCHDKKSKMRWLMCYARSLQEEGYDYSRSMKEAWKQIKTACNI